MQEKQVISQLKGLKSIKPAKDWVCLVKKDLLTEPIELQNNVYVKEGFFEGVFSLFAKPAFVISAVLTVGFLLVGSFVYFNFQKSAYDLQTFIDKMSSQSEANKQAVASLQTIQGQVEEVKATLLAMKGKDPQKILAVAEVVKATAKNSQQTVESIKNSNSDLSKQALLALDTVKSASLDLEKTSVGLQVEMFKAYLTELKAKTLSNDDQTRLAAAEGYFKDGKTEEAILLLIKVGEGSGK